MRNMTYVANVINENLTVKEIKAGISVFTEHLNREGIGLRVVHVTESRVVYEPFVISWEAPITLETNGGKSTTLKLSMPISGLPSKQKKSILDEARGMLRTGEVFVIGGDYCSLLGINTVKFTPNIGEQYHRVMKNGIFMPHKYSVPKSWALEISRMIEDVTVDYIMSLDGSYLTRKETLESGEYEITSYKLFDDIRTPDRCFVTPNGNAACAFDLFGKETGTLSSAVPLTVQEQEEVYEGIINYLKQSVADAYEKAFEEREANLRYGM